MSNIYVHPSGDLVFASEFIGKDEEAALLRGLYGPDYAEAAAHSAASAAGNNNSSSAVDDMEQREGVFAPPPRLPWVQLSRRRLLNLGGVPGSNERAMAAAAAASSSSAPPKISAMIPEPIPKWALEPVGSRLLAVSAAMEAAAAAANGGGEVAEGCALPQGELALTSECAPSESGDVGPIAAVLSRLLSSSHGEATPSPMTTPSGRPTPLHRVCASTINHILVNEYLGPSGIMGHEDGPAYEPIVSIVSAEGPVMLRFESKRLRRARGEAAAAARARQVSGAVAGSEVSANAVSSSVEAEERPGDVIEVFLPPRSLVVFRGAFYTEYLHSVPEGQTDVFSKERCLNYGEAVAYSAAINVKEEKEATSIEGRGEGAHCAVARGYRRVSLTYRRVLNVSRLSAASLFGRRR